MTGSNASPPAPIAVGRIAESQYHDAVAVLAQAFYNDPTVQFAHPDPGRRRAWLNHTYAMHVRSGLRYGEVYVSSDVSGAAIWLQPGKAPVTVSQMVQMGAVAWMLRSGLGVTRRCLAWVEASKKLHKQCLTVDHWYLAFLGVDPSRQGQGIGSALLQPVLKRADADGLCCYLDTSSPRALRLYERNGFEIRAEADIPGGGPHTWAMVREPRKGAVSGEQ